MSTTLTNEEIHAKILHMAAPVLENAGVDLVELHVGRNRSEVQVQFTADLPMGGITIETCAQLNRAIVDIIDADGFLGENYTLEFSSPGLDRPLKTAKDFFRNLDQDVHFWLAEAIEGKKEWEGKVTEVNSQSLTVLAKKRTLSVPLAKIVKAVLVI